VEKASREMEGVSWLKWLPRAEILERMKDASVLILPSMWYEGFPMILAEAFAVGLPVIASNLGSMSTVVDHLRTGLHFEPGNASDLVEKVRWLRAHPAEVGLMRAQARKEYETKYTAEKNYAQMIHIYESVLSPGFPVGPGETNELHAAFR
jgi:glycosyltransferase involved in cell wall biosynthesis